MVNYFKYLTLIITIFSIGGAALIIKESGENYLEAMLVLENKNGYIRSVDIAKMLNVSKPSVSKALRVLASANYIQQPISGKILLTAAGREKAAEVLDRHNTIADYLTKVLGTPEDISLIDACRIEHVISEITFQKIKEAVK